tara:strand:+ start:522 stop:1049 length:528 start_codon:yes stop_codon:yes gene_type:complete
MTFATMSLVGLLGLSSVAHAQDVEPLPIDHVFRDLATVVRDSPDEVIESRFSQTIYRKNIEMEGIRYIVSFNDKGDNGVGYKDRLEIQGYNLDNGERIVESIDGGLNGFPLHVLETAERFGDGFYKKDLLTDLELHYGAFSNPAEIDAAEWEQSRQNSHREYLQLAFSLTNALQR